MARTGSGQPWVWLTGQSQELQNNFTKTDHSLSFFQDQVSFLPKAITQSILGQNQHPGTFLESSDQGLSFGTKIYGLSCFTMGDISFKQFDPSYTLPTVDMGINVITPFHSDIYFRDPFKV